MEFSREKYRSGLLRPPLEDLLVPGVEPASLTSPTLADRFLPTSTNWEAQKSRHFIIKIVAPYSGSPVSLILYVKIFALQKTPSALSHFMSSNTLRDSY